MVLVWFVILGVQGHMGIPHWGDRHYLAFYLAYTLVGVPLLAVAIWKRRECTRIFFGELDVRGLLLKGLVPVLGYLALLIVMILFLTHKTGKPYHDFAQQSLYDPWEMLLGLGAPFVEEMLYRVWLQSKRPLETVLTG
ncbi:MAG: hypothetical protein ACYDG3_12620 [Bacillati bacterium]